MRAQEERKFVSDSNWSKVQLRTLGEYKKGTVLKRYFILGFSLAVNNKFSF
jgi:hypothetical protein